MIFPVDMLASSNPIEHILDVPWRIAGQAFPWMSSQIAVMLLATAILLIGAPLLVRRSRRRGNRSFGLVELLVAFVRQHIARPAMGPAGDQAVPLLATLFTFLLACNLLGLVPLTELGGALGLAGWGGVDAAGRPMNAMPIGGTPTSGLWVCGVFASMTLLLVMFSGYGMHVRRLWKGAAHGDVPGRHPPARAGMNLWLVGAQRLQRRTWPLPVAVVGGLWSWLNGFVPAVPGVVGFVMWPILLLMELIGYVSKCFALCLRLLVNMTAGHVLLALLMGLAQGTRGWLIPLAGLPAGLGVIALMILELLVAALQAYIFTFLSALFIGLAIKPQH